MGSVIVGVDGSANSIAALKWAAHYAKSTDGVVHAVYVWSYPITAIAPAPIGGAAVPADLMTDAASEALAGFIAEAELPDDIHVVHVVREGSTSKVLLEHAKDADADILVVGARGHGGFTGLLLGSVANAVINHAPCPVAVIPAK
jgi:nucleotide-binding universal stress UspA family protein